jgi:hypothetical protein
MTMKKRIMISIVVATTAVGCGQLPTELGMQSDASSPTTQAGTTSAVTQEEQAANQLYLDDMVESTTVETPSDEPEDDSIKEDCKAERVAHMSAMILDRLDANDSGDLTLEEFLAGPTSASLTPFG